jgi:anti-anti-sigma factor
MSDDQSPVLSITIDSSSQDFVVAIDGEMDAATAATVRSALEAIEPTDSARVVVDLERVAFIDSSGLLVLLQGREWLAERNMRLVVRNPRPQARRLFDLGLCGDRLEEVLDA